MKSAEEIIEKLRSSFYTPSRKDEKLKVVVFCILISTTFWFFSALNKADYTTQIQYPIEFKYDPNLYVAVSELPDKLPIDVTGGGWDLMTRSFGFGMEPISIDLEDPSVLRYHLSSTLRGDLSASMTDINLNFILNDTLFYNIQKRVKRRIPVAFDSISIVLDEGHEITSSINLEPKYIELEGPENLVNAFSNPFIVYPGSNSFDDNVDDQFEIPSLGSSLINADVSEVRAIFEVTEFIDFDEMRSVELVNAEDSTLTIFPSRVRVFYRKDERFIDQVADTVELSLMADFNTLNLLDSTIEIKAGIQMSYIKGLSIETVRVKVNYE